MKTKNSDDKTKIIDSKNKNDEVQRVVIPLNAEEVKILVKASKMEKRNLRSFATWYTLQAAKQKIREYEK